MAKYKITFDRAACIGAGACAAMDPGNFKMASDGKADLIGGKEVGGDKWEVVCEGNPAVIEGAKACPVEVIKVKNLDTGQQLV